MTEAQERAYHKALRHALDTGYPVLESAGKSVEAVIAALTILKDSPLFNAGKGVVTLDCKGNIAMTFDTDGMYRGFICAKGQASTFLYKDE